MQPASSRSEPTASTSIALRKRSRASGFTRTLTHKASISASHAILRQALYANGEGSVTRRGSTKTLGLRRRCDTMAAEKPYREEIRRDDEVAEARLGRPCRHGHCRRLSAHGGGADQARRRDAVCPLRHDRAGLARSGRV